MELAELKCEEKKLSRQLDVIKKALTELGCEEIPPGCDLPMDASADPTPESQVSTHLAKEIVQ